MNGNITRKRCARPLSGILPLEDLADFALPNLSKPDRHTGLAKQVKRWHARRLAVAGSPPLLGGELFEAAWRLRGFENFMIDLVQRPHLAAYLLRSANIDVDCKCAYIGPCGGRHPAFG